MAILLRSSLSMLLVLGVVPIASADPLFQSGFETLLCDAAVPEFEPNDTAAEANVVVLSAMARSALVCGVIDPVAADVDYFRFSLAATSTLRVATVEGEGLACDPSSTMSLTLFGPSLNQIATVDTAGADGCLALDGAVLAALQNLPPGNYFVRVSVSANGPAYALSLSLL
jgi:hypothetical protein